MFFFLRGRKMDRNFTRYDDLGSGGHPRYARSMSDNWREKGSAEQEEEEGDWRKDRRDKWSKYLFCNLT